MFAFAIWDARTPAAAARARPARDQAALLDAGRRQPLLFGSEIKAILASGLVEARANEAALPELLSTRYVSGDETLFAGHPQAAPRATCSCSRPGTRHDRASTGTCRIEAAGGQHRRRATPSGSRSFRALLEESVRLRLMADVPLGMFLSGGLDSSAIAAHHGAA